MDRVLVLFDFVDLSNPDVIRASIWQVQPDVPGFSYCMIDYKMNIRAKSQSKAPFNLWPFQLKFYLMKPVLIYRSLIMSDNSIDTQLFPNRDDPVEEIVTPLTNYSRSLNLTKDKILLLSDFLKFNVNRSEVRAQLLSSIDKSVSQKNISSSDLADLISKALYYLDIEPHITSIPKRLRDKLYSIDKHIEILISSFG